MAASLDGNIQSTKYTMNLKQLLWTYYWGLKYTQSVAELTTAEVHDPASIRIAQLISYSVAAVGYADL